MATTFSKDPPNPQCSRRAPACPTAGMCNTSAVRGARCVHSPPLMPFSLLPARDDYLRQCPSLPRLSFSRSPKYHPRAPPPACGALAGRFTIGGATPAHHHHRYVAPPPPWFTIDAVVPHTPDARRHRHAQRSTASASQPPRSSRTRNVPPWRNYLQVRRAATPTAFLAPRWSVTCAGRRRAPSPALPRDSKSTTRCARCPARLGRHLMRAPDAVPRRHARHRASALPSTDPHRQPHRQCVILAVCRPRAARPSQLVYRLTRAPPTLFSTIRNTSRVRSTRARATVVPHRRRRIHGLLMRHRHPLSSPLDATPTRHRAY
ncbi:hypothetical protein K438DRAFT_96603 [Mycena galopus ATCC 62051]|nr:hypothetical protein K438DRAFT_96603 [Mycena galopus ATCC 62051]